LPTAGASPTPLPTVQTGAWTPARLLPAARFEMAAAVLDGVVYATDYWLRMRVNRFLIP